MIIYDHPYEIHTNIPLYRVCLNVEIFDEGKECRLTL
jgi:hypothetical protein